MGRARHVDGGYFFVAAGLRETAARQCGLFAPTKYACVCVLCVCC